MHEQYGNRKEEVNEGVSQWLWKSLDERKRLWEFTVKRQKRHAFCFQERVFKDSIVWGKNILYFHEPIPERVFRSSTAGHTRKIENDKDVYKGCSFKWTLLALWMYSPIGFFFFFPRDWVQMWIAVILFPATVLCFESNTAQRLSYMWPQLHSGYAK